MDSFEVVITPDAMAMLTNIVGCIAFEKQNPGAADSVYVDALEQSDRSKYTLYEAAGEFEAALGSMGSYL